MIYHIVRRTVWEAAIEKGFYETDSFIDEGFIHASKDHQVSGVLARYYKDVPDLLLLHIDELKLNVPLVYETAITLNEEFPHIFGRLNIEAVINTTPI